MYQAEFLSELFELYVDTLFSKYIYIVALIKFDTT